MIDLTHYIPNQTVLNALQKVTLVTIVGPSGSGKTTLIHEAIKQDPNLHVVISDVSRPKRPEEKDGVDYYFQTREAMQNAIEAREYVQVAPSNSGDFYATRLESYSTERPSIITVWAEAMLVFKALPFKTIRIIFITPPSFEIWQERLNQHHFDEELKAKRLNEARRSFAFAMQQPGVQFVINDDLQTAVHDLCTLAHGNSMSEALIQKQVQARTTIKDIQSKLL